MAETEDSPATPNGGTGIMSGASAPHGEAADPRSTVDLDVSWLVDPDLPAIDILVRLHVVAVRGGLSLWLHGATGELVDLLELVGLRGIVHLCPCAGRGGVVRPGANERSSPRER